MAAGHTWMVRIGTENKIVYDLSESSCDVILTVVIFLKNWQNEPELHLTQTIMAYPKDLDAQIRQLEVSIEYHRRALNVCSESFPYRPDIQSSYTEQYAQLGHCYFQKNDIRKAIRLYLQTRATDPNHFQALYLLGKCYYQLKQFEDARNIFSEIIERVRFEYDRHHQINAWLGIASTYIEEGKENSLNKAEKYLALVRENVPKHPDLKEVLKAFDLQQQVMDLIEEARHQINTRQWLRANTTIIKLKGLAPNHPDASQLEQILHQTVSNHALIQYSGALFNFTSITDDNDIDVSFYDTTKFDR